MLVGGGAAEVVDVVDRVAADFPRTAAFILVATYLVLFLHARGQSAPLDVIASLGAADGHLCAATALMSSDPATADSKRASADLRLRNSMSIASRCASCS